MNRTAAVTCLGLALALSGGVHLSAGADSRGVAPVKGAQASLTTAPMKPNGSGIVVRYQVTQPSAAGGTATVVLRFERVADPANASYRLVADGGLTVAGIGAVQPLPAGETDLTLEARPPASGIGYLHVFTSQFGTKSVTSIPVQAFGAKASEALPAARELKQTPGGDKSLPMPVK
jgi:hypothetical protein